MDQTQALTMAACVAAWHNRHPLARRITPAQVQSQGWVLLPFLSGEHEAGQPPVLTDALLPLASAPVSTLPSLRPPTPPFMAPLFGALRACWHGLLPLRRAGPKLAGADATRQGFKAAFSENFIHPLSLRQVARFAVRHGVLQGAAHDAAQDVPHDPNPQALRQVLTDPHRAPAGATLVQVQLATAAVEWGGKRCRVLCSRPNGHTGGLAVAVLGPRLWSPPRVGAALVTLLALAAAGPLLHLSLAPALELASASAAAHAAVPPDAPVLASPATPPTAPPATPSTAQAAESVAVAAPAFEKLDITPAAGSVATAMATEVAKLATPQPQPAAPAASADAGVSNPATPSASMAVPNLRLALDEAQKTAARGVVSDLRAARAAAAPVATLHADPKSTPVLATNRPNRPAFALTTRPLRTRAEAEQTVAALRSLLGQGAGTGAGPRVDMLAAGDDWRVVCFPFDRMEDAERARTTLAARGLRLDPLSF